jgi:hypothetical protein
MALYLIPRWSVATAFVFHGGEVEVRLEHFIGSAAKPHALYLNGIVDLGSMEDSDYHRIVCYFLGRRFHASLRLWPHANYLDLGYLPFVPLILVLCIQPI